MRESVQRVADAGANHAGQTAQFAGSHLPHVGVQREAVRIVTRIEAGHDRSLSGMQSG
jgi:hypothetical protein